MQNSNKIIQAIGIPYTALLSVIFGLLIASLPLGVFVVFDSEIGGDLNYEYPLTHLELFAGTEIYQSPIDVSVGDAFVILWSFYVVLFVISVLGPRRGFFKSISLIMSFGKYDSKSNDLIKVITGGAMFILISLLIK